MSDVAHGPGWWQASDGRWYPPESLARATAPSPTAVPPTATGLLPPLGQGQPTIEYGPPPPQEPPGFTWPAYPTYAWWNRQRVVGALVVLLGVAGLVWATGEAFIAAALNGNVTYPRDEQIGAWIVVAGIALVSLVTVAVGLVHRRP